MTDSEETATSDHSTGTTAIPRWFLALASVAMLLPILRYGREFFVPVAFALLVFILIIALRERTARISIAGRRIPGWLARVLSFAVVASAVWVTASVIAANVSEIVAAMPDYVRLLGERVAALAPVIGEDTAQKLHASLATKGAADALGKLLAPGGALIATAILILFYVLFMMAERDAFKRKLPHVVGSDARAAALAETVRSISVAVQEYMWINTLTSLMAGLTAFGVLAVTGAQFAGPLAVLVFFTAFIPTIGTVFGIAFPALIALIEFGADWRFWTVLAVGGVLRLVIDNVIQPAMAGRGLNLSSLVVMLGLALWSGLWGLAGAFLSVPLMVVIMIVCDRLPALRPVAALLSADGHVERKEESGR